MIIKKNKMAIITAMLLGSFAANASDVKDIKDNESKDAADPTKIITRAGLAFVDERWTVSGSVGLDETKMVSARVSEDADEWRIGGSWLFDFGILNFNFSRSDYDDGAYKNNYSVGTFVPLSVFGIEPYGFQIFPMAGYSYNDGEYSVDDVSTPEIDDFILKQATSHGMYAGAFTLKPINDSLTAMAFAGGNYGSDDYSGYWFGGGLSYKINKQNSVRAFGMKTDDDFGSDEKFGAIYTYEF